MTNLGKDVELMNLPSSIVTGTCGCVTPLKLTILRAQKEHSKLDGKVVR